MRKKHKKIIHELVKIAEKSSMRCKHAAAIVNRGAIVSSGFNYILPHGKGYYSIHAERNALLKCNPKLIKGSSLYVIRVSRIKKDEMLLSLPCKICQSLIQSYQNKYNLKNVYYSTI